MKKLMYLGLVATALSIYSCGGDNNSSNPNDKAEEFSNPTGTLTSSNANAVGQASLDANGASGASNPFSLVGLSKTSSNSFGGKYDVPYTHALDEDDAAECITTADTGESTIDWECVFDLDTEDECTGSGTTVTSIDTDGEGFYTLDYNDFAVNCGVDGEYSCDGTISISTETVGLFCSDFTCNFNDLDHTFDGCVNAEGEILLNVDGESFVMTSIATDGTCSAMTFSITDSTGTSTLTCDVTTAEEGCSTVDGVQTVGSCTIS